MFDTESVSDHLVFQKVVGAPAIIAFTGMARGLNELANFEFMKTAEGFSFTKIFVRDPHFAFYHRGIDDYTQSIPALKNKLLDLLAECGANKITCVGVSAGGYASLLFGHLLGADYAHAFGPQTILYKNWGIENGDDTVYNCEALHSLDLAPENDFRDLKKVLSIYNGKTKYWIHIGKNNEQDLKQAGNIKDCPAVEIVYYDCAGHACASHELRKDGKLGKIIAGELL